jgi:hypothetical protein
VDLGHLDKDDTCGSGRLLPSPRPPTPAPPKSAVARVTSTLALGVRSEVSVILKLGLNGWTAPIDGAIWSTASATAETAASATADAFPHVMIQPCHIKNEDDEIRTTRREGSSPPA